MKRENVRLRLRLVDIESQLLQMETDTTRRFSTRLKPERQRRLMEEKTSIQELLDRIIYPILSIPVEIISEIFLHCLPVDGGRPDPKLAPMLLGRICRVWRHIAYTDPRLWSSLHISYPDWGRLNPFRVQEWFLRAGSVPLSLSLALPYDHCSFFRSQLCFCPSASLFADHWVHLTSFYGYNFTLTECFDLLLRAPRLIRCELFSIRGSTPPTRTTRILLVDLEVLTFKMDTDMDTLLLDSLTLPKLRCLSLVCTWSHRFIGASFLSFLQRAPNIQTFNGQFSGTSRENGVLATILRAMPVLTSLELRLYSSALYSSAFPVTIIFNILRHLHESLIFLPRIRKLHFYVFERVSWEDRLISILVDALTSRWEAQSDVAQLVDFEFLFPMYQVTELDVRIADCVSRLKEKGMRIYVGPRV